MKILLISGEFPPMVGGMGDYTKELAKALAKPGNRVSVLTSLLGQDGGENFRLYPRVSKWDFSSWKAIIALIEEIEPQIVHLQYQAAAYGMHPAINLLPWRLRRRHPLLFVTFHDLRVPYLFPKAGPLRRWAIAALAKGCDGVIVTNVGDEAEARGYGLKPYLIPIGSNITPRLPPGYDREEWRARWGIKEETLLSYFGLLHESKGVETLFRALARLLEGGERVKLLMVGGKTGASDPTTIDYAQRMEALGRELGLEILWTGYVEDEEVSANLLASDICVLPYRDGVSFQRGSLMAALAHGLPIISTRPDIQIEDLKEGENIVLVPPDDAEALAAKIQELAASEGLRRRLGEGALALAQDFSWDEIAKRTLEVYSEASDSRLSE
jgi:glycosyltransferase involved in cell wall biosynthesis